MTDRTIAHPAHDLEHVSGITARVLRGIALHAERGAEIVHEGRGVYTVPGCSGGSYTVRLVPLGGEESCTCPDHHRHPEHSCKHLVAATLYRAKTRRPAARTRRPLLSPEAVAANLARMEA